MPSPISTSWTGAAGNGLWSDPNNWTNGVPPAGGTFQSSSDDVATIDNSVETTPFTVTIAGSEGAGELIVNAADPSGGVAVSLTGEVDMFVNQTAGGAGFGSLELQHGTFEIDGGTLTGAEVSLSGGTLAFGAAATWGADTLNGSIIDGGLTIGNASDVVIAQSSYAVFEGASGFGASTTDYVTDGSTLSAQGTLYLDGTMDIESGTVSLDGGGLQSWVGPATLLTDGGSLVVTQNAGVNGDWTIEGGMSLTGGQTVSVTSGSSLTFGSNALGSVTTINLNGGTLDVTGSLNLVDTKIENGTLILESGSTYTADTSSSLSNVTLTDNRPVGQTNWTGAAGDGDWSNADNWTNGVPQSGLGFASDGQSVAVINNSLDTTPFTLTISGSQNAQDIDLATTDPSGAPSVSLTGTLDTSWNGEGGAYGSLNLQSGTFEIDGGTLAYTGVGLNGGSLTFGSQIQYGQSTLGNDIINGSPTIGNQSLVVLGGYDIFHGQGGYGPTTVTLTGGADLLVAGTLALDGVLDIQDGADYTLFSLDGGNLQGYGGDAATIFIDGGNFAVDHNTTFSNAVAIYGGTMVFASGGVVATIDSSSTTTVGQAGGAQTVVDLNGGTLDVFGTLDLVNTLVENGTIAVETGAGFSQDPTSSLSNVTLTGVATTATNWTGGGDGTNWDDPNNWDNGVPVSGGPYSSLQDNVTTIDDNHGDGGPYTVTITGAQYGADVIVNTPDPDSGVAVSLQGSLNLAFNTNGGSSTLGVLNLQQGTFEVDGGTLQALTVQQDGGQIAFGSASAWGASTLNAAGITGNFDIGNSSEVVVAQYSFAAFNEAEGSTVGDVSVDYGSTLDIQGSLSTGNNIDINGGAVVLDGGTLSTSNGARVIENSGAFTVQGYGTLQNAILDGDFEIGGGNQLTVAAGDTAVLEKSDGSTPVAVHLGGGTLEVQGVLDVLGEIIDQGQLILEDGSSLKDAAVQGVNSATIPTVTVNGDATLDNVSIDAPVTLNPAGTDATLTIAGVVNFGNAADSSPMQVNLDGGVLEVTGTLNLVNTDITNGAIIIESGGSLTTDSTSELSGVTLEQILSNGDLQISGQDVVVQGLQAVTASQGVEIVTGANGGGTASGTPGHVTFSYNYNAGFVGAGQVMVSDLNGPSSTDFGSATLDADVSSQTLTFDTATYSTNYGTFEASNGGSLVVGDAANAASNLASGVISAEISATGGSSVLFYGASGVTTLNGSVTLDPTSSFDVATPGGEVSLAQSLTNLGSQDPVTYADRSGQLNLNDGVNFIDPNTLYLLGQIQLGGGTLSTAGISGSYVSFGSGIGAIEASGVVGFGTIEGPFGSTNGSVFMEASGGTLTYDGTLGGFVSLLADANSTLVVNSPIDTQTYTNGYSVSLASGATVEITGAVTDATNFYTTISGTNATLSLADPHDQTFKVNINGDATGGVIDLAGLTAVVGSDGEPDVQISRPSPSEVDVIVDPADDPGHYDTFIFGGSVASMGLSFSNDDGHGGSAIKLGPGPDAAVPIVEPGSGMEVESNGAYLFTQKVHVGDPNPLSDAIIVVNQDQHNPNQDTLSGGILGASGYGITASGAFSGLTPGSSTADLGGTNVVGDGTPITFTVDTSTGGLKTSTVQLGFSSDSATPGGPVQSLLPEQTVTVQAGVYRYAALTLPKQVFHIHASADTAFTTLYLPIENSAAADGYSEGLIATVTGSSGDFTGNEALGGADPTGTTGLVAAGSSDPSDISFQADTNPDDFDQGRDTVETGTITLSVTSDGTGTSGLGQTQMGTVNVPIDVEFYRLAQADVPTPQVFSVHATEGSGDQYTELYLSVSNIAASDGFSEDLDASIVGSSGDFTGQSGAADPSGSAQLIAAGDTSSDELAFEVETNIDDLPDGRDTVQTGDIQVALYSDGSTTSGFGKTYLGTVTVPVTVDLDPLAKPVFKTTYDVHATEPGTLGITELALETTNNANSGADSLVSTIKGATGDFTIAGSTLIPEDPHGTTSPIAPGATDDSSMVFDVVTDANEVAADNLETQTGTITVGNVSNPELSNDPNAAITQLPTQNLDITVNVMGYAEPIIEGVNDFLSNPYNPTPGAALHKTVNLGVLVQGQNGFHPYSFANAAGPDSDSLEVSPGNGYQAAYPDGILPGDSFTGDAADGGGLDYGGGVGQHSVTVDFTPYSVNSDESAQLTPVDVTYTWTVLAKPQVAVAWGDVHMTTFAGTAFNFQAEGEFILAESTTPGNGFQVQIRTTPFYQGASVSVIDQIGAEIGTDRVTISLGRTSPIWINGQAASISDSNPVIQLAGGQIDQLDDTHYQIIWNTGEVMNVFNGGSYLSVTSLAPGANDAAGSFAGLLGPGNGSDNDFMLADGTVAPRNAEGGIAASVLYGVFANSWRVTQAGSLLDYGPGQTTATFTDANFPADATQLADLPANVVSAAEATVAAAGITDPTLAAEAALDLIVTGDPNFLSAAQNVQQSGGSGIQTTITQAPPPPSIGVTATQSTLTQASGNNTTAVTFNVYLTGAATTDTVVDYAVIAPNGGYLGADAFGGALPSGSLTIAAGNTTASFTIDLPGGALGSSPSANLEVALTSPAGDPVAAPTAQTEIINASPVAGPAPQPVLAEAGGVGGATPTTNGLSINLGVFVQGINAPTIGVSIDNNAAAGADSLSGAVVDGGGAGFAVGGANAIGQLAPGQAYQGLSITPETTATGTFSDTLTYSPTDVNATGYSNALATEAVTVTDAVIAAADPVLNTTTPIAFGDVHKGANVSEALSFTNAAAAGAASLDVGASLVNGAASVTGSINQLAAGSTDDSSISVALNTANVGDLSAIIQLNYASDTGTGRAYGAGTPQFTATETVYREAAPQITTPAEVVVHTGDDSGSLAETLTIANTDPADGFSEGLRASVTGHSGDTTAASGTTGLIAAGASDASSIGADLSTLSAGLQTGTVTLDLVSDGTGVDSLGQTDLGSVTEHLTVLVDNYAQAALSETAGAGSLTEVDANHYTLNLGSVAQGASALSASLSVLNSASGPAADLLKAAFEAASGQTSAFTTGLSSVNGIGFGDGAAAGTVSLSTTNLGTFTETIQIDPTGYNSGGYIGALSPITLTVTGQVVSSSHTYALTSGTDTVSGGSGINTVVAAGGTLSSGDVINAGSSGANVLQLTGGGTFDMRAPTTLTGITTIDAQEGQAAGGGVASTYQTVWLRSGMSATVDVTSDASPNAADPNAAGITLHGANDSDVIDLGSGTDAVYLGSANETVNAGSGTDSFYETAATAGASINGGAGNDTLYLQGGGTATLGSNVTGITKLDLLGPATGQTQPAWNVTANAIAGLQIVDYSGGADTITVGAGNQTVFTGNGSADRIVATKAEAATVKISGNGAADTLEITDGGAVAVNAADYNVTGLVFDKASSFTLTGAIEHVSGSSGGDTITGTATTLGSATSLNFSGGSNTLVLSGAGTFDLRPTAALTGITTIDAQEGQAAGGGVVSTYQTVWLRSGMSATVDVTSDADPNAADPNAAGITLHGANDSDVIDLGSGTDAVYLGSANETVNAGSGTDSFYETAATAGASINGGAGADTLYLQGGGTATLGSNVTGITKLDLLGPASGQTQPAWNVTANAIAGLQIVDYSGGADTITVGAGSQTVFTGNGSVDRIVATKAEAATAKISGNGAADTLEITDGGAVAVNAADYNVTGLVFDKASSFTLTGAIEHVSGSSGGDTITGTATTLGSATSLNFSGGSNTLVLSGAGAFDLRPTAALTGITTIDAQEGQAAGGGVVSTYQTVWLRSGMSATVDVTSDADPNAADPNAAGITLHGANDSDVIDLGSGTDAVYLGSANETVNAGSGTDSFYETAATAGASINGGTGTDTLYLQGGGTAALGSNVTGITKLDLLGPASGSTQPAWNVTANAIAGLQIVDYSGQADTITLGAASQIVYTGSGSSDLIVATAAQAAAKISGTAGTDTLDIVGGGTAAVNTSDFGLAKVELAQAGSVSVGANVALIQGSAGADSLTAGGKYETLTGGGGADALVGFSGGSDTFKDTAADLNGSSIKNFSATGDRIDVTNIKFAGTAPTFVEDASNTFGTLTVGSGANTSKIILFGQFSAGGFAASGDGGSGQLITYTPQSSGAVIAPPA